MKHLLLLIGIIFILNGCSSRGYFTAQHNGKMYWNPGTCDRYQYYYNDSDKLHCLKEGTKTGQILFPASAQQVQNYYAKQQLEQQALNNLNRSIQETNRNIQMQNQNFELQMLNSNLNGLRYGY